MCFHNNKLAHSLFFSVPPTEPVIMDENGKKLRDIIGPYDEGAFLTLACEVERGET